MGFSQYPRVGFRLAPLSLKEILDEHAPKNLVNQEEISFYELDEESWLKYGKEACLKLADIIYKRCNAFFFLLPEEVEERIVFPNLDLELLNSLELEESTYKCLKNNLVEQDLNSSQVTIGNLLALRCLGMRGLIDLLTSLETIISIENTNETIPRESEMNLVSLSHIEPNNYIEKFNELYEIAKKNLESKTRTFPKWTYRFNFPNLPNDFDFYDLELKIRTEKALNSLDLWTNPQNLANYSVKQILTTKNFGLNSLVDLLAGLKTFVNKGSFVQENKLYQPSFFEANPNSSFENKRTCNSLELKNEAAQLLELDISWKISRNDFRFGDLIKKIDKEADNASDLSSRLIMDENIPFDEERAILLLKDLRGKIEISQRYRLEEELFSFLNMIKSDRDKALISMKFGLDGKGVNTLQFIGDKFQITRERVRQICDKWANQISESEIFAPKIEEAIKLITENSPNLADILQSHLIEERITNDKFELDGIKEFSQLIGIGGVLNFETIEGKLFVVSNEKEVSINIIHKKARKAVEHWGATTIDEIIAQVKGDDENISEEFIKNVLVGRNDFSWLDEEKGWFWLKSVPRNRLYNQIRKILSVSNQIEVSELRSGISRHHRMKGLSPPKRVILEFCQQSGLANIEDSKIVSKTEINFEEELSDIEQFLTLILKENDGIILRVDLEKGAVDLGINLSSFYVYLGYSPIIVRHAMGVYGLRGATIPVGKVESLMLQTQTKRGKVLKDFGWKDTEHIWIVYELSESAIKSGVIGIPAAVKKYIEGDFLLKTEDNQIIGKFTIKDASGWGLGNFFRRRGGEVGDSMLLIFNLVKREIQIQIGGDNLTENLQGKID